jgi:ubiquinone/menaquinone biosynthesis C-methylase UbiE
LNLIHGKKEQSGREKIKEIIKQAAFHIIRYSEWTFGFIIMNKYFGRRALVLADFHELCN